MLSRSRLGVGTTISLSDRVMLRLSGIGAARASAACDSLLAAGAQALLSWGVAAGLDRRLPAGRLLLPIQIVGRNGVLDVDSAWHTRLLRHLGCNFAVDAGPLAQTTMILSTTGDKARLHEESGAAAADMESAAILAAAQRASVPALILRAVSDPAGIALPESIHAAMNADGDVAVGALLRALAGRPTDIPELLKVAASFYCARSSLRKVAAAAGPEFLY